MLAAVGKGESVSFPTAVEGGVSSIGVERLPIQTKNSRIGCFFFNYFRKDRGALLKSVFSGVACDGAGTQIDRMARENANKEIGLSAFLCVVRVLSG